MAEWDWNTGRPTPEDVRKWGYDEDFVFLSQDEDIVLHQPEFISVLMELSADESCPKNDYSFGILCYYVQILFCHRNYEEIEKCYENMEKHTGHLSQDLEIWQRDFLYLRNLLNNPQLINPEEADRVAILLSGVGVMKDEKGTILFEKKGYHVFHTSVVIQKLINRKMNYCQYHVSGGGYVHFIYIHLEKGIWKCSRHFALSDYELLI